MIGAIMVEFCKELLDGDRLIVKSVLYIRVASKSGRLVSRFFHFKLSFTSTSTCTDLMPYDMINTLIMKRVPETQTLEFQGSSWTGRLLIVRGAGYLRKLKNISNRPPHFIIAL